MASSGVSSLLPASFIYEARQCLNFLLFHLIQAVHSSYTKYQGIKVRHCKTEFTVYANAL